MLTNDAMVEKKVLGIITRLFNQREELKKNLLRLEVIFEKEKALVHSVIAQQVQELQRIIERMEEWS